MNEPVLLCIIKGKWWCPQNSLRPPKKDAPNGKLNWFCGNKGTFCAVLGTLATTYFLIWFGGALKILNI